MSKNELLVCLLLYAATFIMATITMVITGDFLWIAYPFLSIAITLPFMLKA